jgi:hypothetical protein
LLRKRTTDAEKAAGVEGLMICKRTPDADAEKKLLRVRKQLQREKGRDL